MNGAGDGPVPVDAAGHPRCERSLNWTGKLPHCGEPAVALTRAMCLHEHLGEGYICWGCLAEMRQFCEDTEWECQACGEGPEPHGCPMPITVTILDSPAERAIRAQLEAK
jgi:hypothetical protein